MPISKSAKKSLRVSRTKTSVNRHRKALIKEALKTVDEKTVSKAVSMIDKAAKWGIFHRNKAARLKSNLAKEFSGTPKAEKSVTKTKPKAAAKTKAKTVSAKTAKPKSSTKDKSAAKKSTKS